MARLLQIDSSPLPSSVSRELTREYARTWKGVHPDGQVIYRDLAAQAAQPIDAEWIGAAYTPLADQTPEQASKLALSNELISELESANEYVIGVAMHNFGVPSVLKLWVDQVVRRGRTFQYDESGPRGLLKGKKATVIVASGAVYTQGSPYAAMDHAEPYLRTILSFLGVTEVNFIGAGGTASLMSGKVDRATFLKPAIEQLRAVAV